MVITHNLHKCLSNVTSKVYDNTQIKHYSKDFITIQNKKHEFTNFIHAERRHHNKNIVNKNCVK